MPHISDKTPHTSCFTSLSSYLISHVSLLKPHTSYLVFHFSILIPHISCFSSQASYLIYHVSLLKPHTSYGISCSTSIALPGLAPLNSCFINHALQPHNSVLHFMLYTLWITVHASCLSCFPPRNSWLTHFILHSNTLFLIPSSRLSIITFFSSFLTVFPSFITYIHPQVPITVEHAQSLTLTSSYLSPYSFMFQSFLFLQLTAKGEALLFTTYTRNAPDIRPLSIDGG